MSDQDTPSSILETRRKKKEKGKEAHDKYVKDLIGNPGKFFDEFMESFIVQNEAATKILGNVLSHYNSRLCGSPPYLTTTRLITFGTSGTGKTHLFKMVGEKLGVPVTSLWASDFIQRNEIYKFFDDNEGIKDGVVLIDGFDSGTFETYEERRIYENLSSALNSILGNAVVVLEFSSNDIYKKLERVKKTVPGEGDSEFARQKFSSESSKETERQEKGVSYETFTQQLKAQFPTYLLSEFSEIVSFGDLGREDYVKVLERGSHLPRLFSELEKMGIYFEFTGKQKFVDELCNDSLSGKNCVGEPTWGLNRIKFGLQKLQMDILQSYLTDSDCLYGEFRRATKQYRFDVEPSHRPEERRGSE